MKGSRLIYFFLEILFFSFFLAMTPYKIDRSSLRAVERQHKMRKFLSAARGGRAAGGRAALLEGSSRRAVEQQHKKWRKSKSKNIWKYSSLVGIIIYYNYSYSYYNYNNNKNIFSIYIPYTI